MKTMKQPAIIRAKEADNTVEFKRTRNRPQAVASTIKDWIIELGLSPGDRLPQEPELIQKLGVSKGTLRESLKVLETQGLIRTRTGPGGGAFISRMDKELASSLLANHFFFEDLSIADIYEMRIVLEPQLVQELAKTITKQQIKQLCEKMSHYTNPPNSIEEEQVQRIAELEFHETLASFCPNPLLSFTCGFLVRLLKDLTVCKTIYQSPNPELRERGLSYQEQLIEAFSIRDASLAFNIMQAHMRIAEKIMTGREAQIEKKFLGSFKP